MYKISLLSRLVELFMSYLPLDLDIFSSPEPLAHGELLWSLDVCRATCIIVRRQQLLQRTSPPKLLAGFWPNLVGIILIWPSLKIVQMVQVHCISRSHRLKIDFQDENFKNLLLCNHNVWSFDIYYVALPSGPLQSLFKLSPWGQKWPCLGGHMLYIGLYGEKHEKIFLSVTTSPRTLIFCM